MGSRNGHIALMGKGHCREVSLGSSYLSEVKNVKKKLHG